MKFGQVADYKKGNNIDMQNRDMLKFEFRKGYGNSIFIAFMYVSHLSH